MSELLHRRSFLLGVGASLVAAPAVVRAASLMPVRAPKLISLNEWIVIECKQRFLFNTQLEERFWVADTRWEWNKDNAFFAGTQWW